MLNARPLPDYDPQSVLTKVDFGDDDTCWWWMGNIDQYGYGTYGHENHMVHRVIYELFVDKLSTEESVDHLCMNRSCVNPNHLEVVTLSVNILRGNNPYAVNARKTHCKYGHEFTTENTYTHPQRGNRHCKTCIRLASIKFTKKERVALSLSI